MLETGVVRSEQWKTILGAGVVLGELAVVGAASMGAFEFGRRQEIKKRDWWQCQIAGCICGTKLSIHHLIPESVLKGKMRLNNGVYSDGVLLSYRIMKRQIEANEGDWNEYKRDLQWFVSGVDNGVTLCQNHHRKMHEDSIETVELKPSENHLCRPRLLTVPYINGLMVAAVEERMIADGFDPSALWVEMMEGSLENMKQEAQQSRRWRDPVAMEMMYGFDWRDFGYQAAEYSTPMKSM